MLDAWTFIANVAVRFLHTFVPHISLGIRDYGTLSNFVLCVIVPCFGVWNHKLIFPLVTLKI